MIQKNEAMKNLPRPLTPIDIRCFLRLAGYYRRFVDGFGSISSLLTNLTKNTVKSEWSEACEYSINILKDRLTSAPILTLPEGTKRYIIYCDASRVVLRYVFMQHVKLVSYASIQLR